jgi:hypothetical protein
MSKQDRQPSIPAPPAAPPAPAVSPEQPKAPAEDPPLPGLGAETIAAVDTLLRHLLECKTHWKEGVPEVADTWLPLFQHVLSTDHVKARALVRDGQVMSRIYPGTTPREKILVVRAMGTNYVRAKVLPWTAGK